MEKHEVARMDTSYNLDKAIPDPNNCPPSQEGSLSLGACKTEALTGVIIAHQDAGKHTSTSINGVVPSGAVTINIEGESGDAIKLKLQVYCVCSLQLFSLSNDILTLSSVFMVVSILLCICGFRVY